jgi:hypothetical protein
VKVPADVIVMPGVVSFSRVQSYLNAIADANGAIASSPHRRFWNTGYQAFVDGILPNVQCSGSPVPIIDKADPNRSPFFLILQGAWCNMPQMPRGGPYITEDSFEVDLPDGTAATGHEIRDDLANWLSSGFPENA